MEAQQDLVKQGRTDFSYKHTYVAKTVFYYCLIHVYAFFGLLVFHKMHWQSYLVFTFIQYVSTIGVTMGAHRLYSHRAYKANAFVRGMLAWFMTYAGQSSIFKWARDHRLHHKFVDADGDPYNASRGFYFSHMGWFLQKRHPKVITEGNQLDLSDLYNDKIVMFQHKHFKSLFLINMYAIPVALAYFLWNEDPIRMFMVMNLSYVFGLHRTFFVNSAAHAFGLKPYNKNITATDNGWVSFFTLGEGWHNYHHLFPSDYRASEYGLKWSTTTLIIDFCASMGWIWERKQAPPISVQKAVLRTLDNEKRELAKKLIT